MYMCLSIAHSLIEFPFLSYKYSVEVHTFVLANNLAMPIVQRTLNVLQQYRYARLIVRWCEIP